MPADDRLDAARADLRAFVDEREWDAFHAPKDLALSLCVESGELLEIFQWRPSDAPLTDEDRRRVREETADVAMYALLLADKVGFDLVDAIRDKLALNRAKYPAEKARGKADKYDRL